MSADAPPAAPDDPGPPLAVCVLPAATAVGGALFMIPEWYLASALCCLAGAAVGVWCFTRKVFSTLPLVPWNVMILISSGYELL